MAQSSRKHSQVRFTDQDTVAFWGYKKTDKAESKNADS